MRYQISRRLPRGRRSRIRGAPLLLAATVLLASSAAVAFPSSPAAAQRPGEIPDGVAQRAVTIWSEGTRMAGDLYRPEAAGPDELLPAIVMSHGWGGTKASLVRKATRFAEAGFRVLAFDYRGWGASDGKLVVEGEMPERAADGTVTVRAREMRTIVDPMDQTLDIRRAFDFVMGEPGVDRLRIGYWGSSYSGAHAIWVAAHEPRAACVFGQVPAANSVDLVRTSWREEDVDILEHARRQAVRRARGEIEPLPQGTDKAPNLRGWTHLDKVIRYNPVEDAGEITIPVFLVDAENEELFDRRIAGELAAERARANGARVEYRVIPDIGHYGIYREAFEESTRMAVEWFGDCLGG